MFNKNSFYLKLAFKQRCGASSLAEKGLFASTVYTIKKLLPKGKSLIN